MKRLSALIVLMFLAVVQAASISVGEPCPEVRSIELNGRELHGDAFVRSGKIRLNLSRSVSPFATLFSTDTLTLKLFSDLTVTAVKRNARMTSGGGHYWSGDLIAGENGYIDLFFQDGYVTGSLYSSDHVYSISSPSEEFLSVVEIDPAGRPAKECDHKEEFEKLVTAPLPPEAYRGTSTVDVMVIYPAALVGIAGGERALENEINYRIEEANQAFTNSSMNVRFRLIHHQVVTDVPSAASSAKQVNTSSVKRLRDQYGADLVSHWNSGGTAGSGNNFNGNKEYGYNTSNFSDVKSRFTFVHECGHNMGGKHDRYTYISQGRGGELRDSYYKYGFMMDLGGSTARTIMSYNQCSLKGIGGSCTRVAHFSNPDVSYRGASTGINAPNKWAANNSRRINECAVEVAKFRNGNPVTETYRLSVSGGDGDGEYEAGQTVTVSGRDSSAVGREFSHWEGDTYYLADDQVISTTVTMPARSVSVRAVYRDIAAEEFTLRVMSGSGDGTYAEGETVRVEANDSSNGRIFSHWSGDVSSLTDYSAGSTTVTMPAENITISAQYKDEQVVSYELIVISGTGDGTYASGESVPIKADDSSGVGRRFLYWSGAVGVINDSASGDAEIIMPSGALTVTAVYETPIVIDTSDLSINLLDWAGWEALNDDYGSAAELDTVGDSVSGLLTTVPDSGQEYSWAKVTANFDSTLHNVSLIKLTYTADTPIRIVLEQEVLSENGTAYAAVLPKSSGSTVFIPVELFTQTKWEGFPDSLLADLDLSKVSAVSFEGLEKGSATFWVSELKFTNFPFDETGIETLKVKTASLGIRSISDQGLSLTVPLAGSYRVTVSGLNGRRLFSERLNFTAGLNQVVTGLPRGVSLVTVESAGRVHTFKALVR